MNKYISPGMYKQITQAVHLNTYDVYSDLINPDLNKSGEFLSFSNIATDQLFSEDAVLLEYLMYISPVKYHYESSIYSISDFLGQLGGTFEIFEIIGRVLIGYYVNKLFYYSAVNCMKDQNKLELVMKARNASSLNESHDAPRSIHNVKLNVEQLENEGGELDEESKKPEADRNSR